MVHEKPKSDQVLGERKLYLLNVGQKNANSYLFGQRVPRPAGYYELSKSVRSRGSG